VYVYVCMCVCVCECDRKIGYCVENLEIREVDVNLDPEEEIG
jgi:hypothetical protein